jgi:hypothetical protein
MVSFQAFLFAIEALARQPLGRRWQPLGSITPKCPIFGLRIPLEHGAIEKDNPLQSGD